MNTLLTADGAQISYERAGTGPAVLMIQGIGVIGNGWRPQVDALSERFTTFTFDNRGMGGSVLGQRSRMTIGAMADDALAIMHREQVREFHLVGHSMGGLIAQAVALEVPSRVLSLSLLCTFARGAEGARMTAATMMTAMRMRIGTRAMRRNAFLELILPARYLRHCNRAEVARRMAPLFGYDLANQPWVTLRQMQAMAAYDAAARWPELADIPALVVSATHDRIALPAYGRRLASLLNGAEYVEFPDAGHGLPIQCAGEVNALLARHVAQSTLHQPVARGT
jgi:pimeloyl-ACP methyl ester carboxylesterase